MSNISHQTNACKDFTHENHSATNIKTSSNKRKYNNTFSQHYIHYWPSLCGHKFGLERVSGMIILNGLNTDTPQKEIANAPLNTFHFQVIAINQSINQCFFCKKKKKKQPVKLNMFIFLKY